MAEEQCASLSAEITALREQLKNTTVVNTPSNYEFVSESAEYQALLQQHEQMQLEHQQLINEHCTQLASLQSNHETGLAEMGHNYDLSIKQLETEFEAQKQTLEQKIAALSAQSSQGIALQAAYDESVEQGKAIRAQLTKYDFLSYQLYISTPV